MNPEVLTVYKSPFPKKRIGKEYDGGYVMVEIPEHKYDFFLSGGISGDISFEENFVNIHDLICYAFDGTINELPHENEKIIFVKKNIGCSLNKNETNLHKMIELNKNIFVKMDIEGGEISWFESLREEHMEKIDQMIIEFHFPFSQKEQDVFEKINKTHVLVHFHPNNSIGTRIVHVNDNEWTERHPNGVIVPNVFECTYLHKHFFESINLTPELNTDTIPTSIDMRNINYFNDIYINYTPFVHSI